MEKTLVLGECKWTLSPVDRDILVSLVEEKTAHIVPKQGYWRIYYLGFSRSGWTKEALNYQRLLSTRREPDRNWQVVGMRLLDLKQVDLDLETWSLQIDANQEDAVHTE